MKKRSFVWIVLLLNSIGLTKAQVIKIENGLAFSKVTKVFDKFIIPYQGSIGIDYMDRGWYNLSSQLGYIRKGGSAEVTVNKAETGGVPSIKDMDYKFDYLTFNTTFRVKRETIYNNTLYAGIGPRIDYFLHRNYTLATPEEIINQIMPDANKVIIGLKCEAGLDYQFDRFLVGLNISYLPSFTKMQKQPKDGIFAYRDLTFTAGIVLGYVL